MHEISIQFEIPATTSLPTDEQFEAWVSAALVNDITDTEICLRIVSKEEIQLLNKTYRQKDKPTNVLSFPYQDEFTPKGFLQGDVIICADVVADEAKKANIDALAHWAHLTVHGVLHIQGYDHENDADALIMEELEMTILAKLGFSNPYRS